jgi:phospholipid/cholesterol/gamma-HCH transport system ATP-binding protein
MSIEVRDIHKAFGDNSVLRGFSLNVTEGETVAVIRQSGSGKSVAIKHVVRLLDPDSGSVHIDGTDIAQLERHTLQALRRKVGYVFQFAALFDSMTIARNIGMALDRVPDMTPEEAEARTLECLALVELDGYGDRFPSQLSGGQKKRAGLARAIATKPKYLLYDEPTTGLDPVTTTVIDRLILRMGDELGVTGIVITHDMSSAYRVADRIAMLYDGRIRFEGTPEEVRACDDPVVKGFVEGRPELMEEAQ